MNKKPKITLSTGIHKSKEIVRVGFDYNRRVIDEIKAKTDAVWSANLNSWYIPKDKFVLSDFFTAMKTVAYIDYSALKNNSNRFENVVQPAKIRLPRNKSVSLTKGYLEKLQQEPKEKRTGMYLWLAKH